MKKIKTNDLVIVLTGKDKGKQGKVLKLLENRVVVSGVNLTKKHIKPDPQRDIEGGIVTREASIHLSNVALFNPTTKKAGRVGFKLLEGKKVRFFKATDEVIEA